MHNFFRGRFESAASTRCLLGWLCLIGLAVLPGCGESGRLPLEGTVTLDGQPLPKGYIQFSPLAGTAGPTAGTDVVDGKFSIPAQGGTFAGKFLVSITAAGRTGRKVINPLSGTTADEIAQLLPPQYNRESKLQAEVKAGGPNRFDFPLVSGKTSAVSQQSRP